VAALLRNEIHAYLVGSDTAVEVARENKEIDILAFLNTDDSERKDAPEVRSLEEMAVPNGAEIGEVSGSNVRGFFVPSDVPADRVATLQQIFKAALNDPQVVADVAAAGYRISYGEPQTMADAVKVTGDVYAKYQDQLS
jgi:tripartite-type tricarboxylate transporter receptor subunit TctC